MAKHIAVQPDRNRQLAEALWREHHTHLERIAASNGAGDEAADAVSRAVAIFILRFNLDDDATAIGWLITAVKREAWATYRARRRREENETPSIVAPECKRGQDAAIDSSIPDLDTPNPQERVEDAELTAERWAAIAQLKPHERQCLGLKALGYSYDEIAEMTGWSRTKINRLMVEGRAALRKLLE